MNTLDEEPGVVELTEETESLDSLAEPLAPNDLYPGSFFKIPAPLTPNTAWRLA
jgi:hypothetical protein